MAELWGPIWKGAIAGIVLAFMIGPVFFALIQTSIEKGFLSGLMFALGISLSDAGYFLLTFFGVSQLNKSILVNQILGGGGGIFLIVFGSLLAAKRPKETRLDDLQSKDSLFSSFIKGFVINFLNPSAFIFWIATVGAVSAQYEGNINQIFTFFMAALVAIFSTDILKAYGAFKLKHFITPRIMRIINLVFGITLIAAGSVLIYNLLMTYVFK